MTAVQHEARVAVRVYDTPVPQGSKVANRFGGGVRDANAARLTPWRAKVTAAAADVARYHDPITGPVRVSVRFTFERPTSHYGTGRNTDVLRPAMLAAHPFPGRACGDLDKLVRACLDSITDAKTIWGDDTQVTDLRARKLYAGEHDLALDQAGVDIIIEAIQ